MGRGRAATPMSNPEATADAELAAIASRLKAARRVVIFAHVRPDGDAIAIAQGLDASLAGERAVQAQSLHRRDGFDLDAILRAQRRRP